MKTFEQLGVSSELVNALKLQNIYTPTEIQEKTIPIILEKKDIIAQSETGSGKTLSYLIPLILNVNLNSKDLTSIILAPTHELVLQIEKQIKLLAQNSNLELRYASIIGGVNISRQLDKLKQKPHIIVGSAGRILELISKKKISAHTVKTIVIDEADRMLDNKNINDIKSIIKSTLKERQILMFSATMPDKAIATANELMKESVLIKTKSLFPDTIEHIYFICEKRDKIEFLMKLLRSENPDRILAFVNNPDEIETIVEKLKYHKFKATGIYGLSNKFERKKSMEDFKTGKAQILVASDLGSRGIDIEKVTYVVNMDIPEEPIFYLHRAGRTGRAGKRGYCVSIITQDEYKWLKKYEKQFNINIKGKSMKYGKIVDYISTNNSVKKQQNFNKK